MSHKQKQFLLSPKQDSEVMEILNRCFPEMKNEMFSRVFFHDTIINHLKMRQMDSIDDYLDMLRQDKAECGFLYEMLHVNYSGFFRNTLTFSVLEAIVFPAMVRKQESKSGSEIRIWSAACADGREAYSVAMLLEEIRKNSSSKVKFRIFASDVNESQVKLAKNGIYSADALQNLTKKRIDQWFSESGNCFKIKPELKSCIDFSVFNLLNKSASCPASSIFGDFDLVFCANLLFYYERNAQQLMIAKMIKCLKGDGFLVCGETERDILSKAGLHEVFPFAAIYRKEVL
jgi:chemotaxis protein methyltransferase CheR